MEFCFSLGVRMMMQWWGFQNVESMECCLPARDFKQIFGKELQDLWVTVMTGTQAIYTKSTQELNFSVLGWA